MPLMMPRWLDDWMKGRGAAARLRAQRTLASHVWPARLLDVLARLREGGHRAYLVGGTVRDALLERKGDPTFDVATDLPPDQVSARFTHVDPIGLRHGTVLVIEPGIEVECTTFRREGAYSDARRPDHVTFTRDPLEDLDRRDFTVNAMAWDPARAELLDPHDGANDLERRRLRAVGEPLERFREDALRPLRAARLAAALEMSLDAELQRALASISAPESGVNLEAVALERVRVELSKMMASRQPSVGLEIMRESGLLQRWLPELAHCVGVPQNRYHAYDVYRHSLVTCDAAPAEKPVVRWAALLHDIGKPDTRVEREGEGTFYGHQNVGADLADRLLGRLRFATEFREQVVHLIREHMFDYRPEWSDGAVRRWIRRVGPERVADLFDLRLADAIGNGKRRGFPANLEALRARIERVLGDSRALTVADLAIDGHGVMHELGLGPGPEVGSALEALLEEVLDHPDRNQEEVLRSRLRQWRAERAPKP
ncbi:MAG TPA: HD domain-containing protein [Candidatus Eisenbacteria bacterium]|nr:HD domain-containing protein [Candidatus Eisenbacteria bacterium]